MKPGRLPNASLVIVPEAKVRDYLLSPGHPQGRFKATFFTAHGYDRERWAELATALGRHALANELVKTEETPFGARYTVEGGMVCPDGRTPRLRSVWFLEHGEDVPRFVTAYPLERRQA